MLVELLPSGEVTVSHRVARWNLDFRTRRASGRRIRIRAEWLPAPRLRSRSEASTPPARSGAFAFAARLGLAAPSDRVSRALAPALGASKPTGIPLAAARPKLVCCGALSRVAPGPPPAIKRLDSLLGAVTIAHEIIFEIRRELIMDDRGNPEQARLLEESARIVTIELPGLSASARQLSARWREQSLLDSEGAEETLAELDSELARIEPNVDSLLNRQREIAAQLRSMREP